VRDLNFAMDVMNDALEGTLVQDIADLRESIANEVNFGMDIINTTLRETLVQDIRSLQERVGVLEGQHNT